MHPFPHKYPVRAEASSESYVDLSSPGVENIPSAAPAEFGGPGDKWSPEALLVSSIADCFILSFKAIARASNLPWESITVDVDGILDRVEKVTQFTEYHINVELTVGEDIAAEKADRLLHKAERTCLVTNSLTGEKHLKTSIIHK